MPSRYRRILLKLSGEALSGDEKRGIDPDVLAATADEIRKVHSLGTQVGVVVGAGNFLRGATAAARGLERSTADQMGMLATVINSLGLQDSLGAIAVPSRVFSAIGVQGVVEPFHRGRAVAALDAGEVVLFAGGTGNPFFTTDTAAALRACEIGADVVLKATRVDGVYSADPEKVPDATLYKTISYRDVLEQELKVMDQTAFTICRENRIPIVVFKMTVGNLVRLIEGEEVGTTVKEAI